MKKLSLLLLTLCISLAGWAASLNPYAYNLSSTWNEATSELTVRFKLNAHPNMKENSSGRGIQIFAIDPSDNNKQYYIYGVPGDIIKAKMNEYNGGKGDSYDYELTIPITGVTWNGADVLPAGKNLTWAVNVAGLNKTDKANPVVVNDNIANRPYSPHGIAVNNDQNSPDFGSIYVTECTDGVSGDATWGWLSSAKGRSLLKYDPTLKYQTFYRKHKDGDATSELFSLRNGNNLLEPHRVRISDDGRIFVSSYNQNGSQTGKPAVWELQKTTGKYTEVITHNPSYGDRVIGMAVKGSGTGLKLLLCYWNLTSYVLKGYEYSWNGTAFVNAALKFTYTPSDQLKTGMGVVHNNTYYCFSDGFVNVAYGAKDNSTIWLGIDLFLNTNYVAYNTRLVHFNSSGNKLEDNTTVVSYGNGPDEYWYYGGAGFVPYVDQNTKTERIAMGRAKIGSGYHGRFCVFDINNSGAIASIPYKLKDGINTGAVVNDFAIDRAHNVYAVSFTDGTTANGKVSNGTTSNGTGRLVAIAMPYGGATMTMAPSTNADANRYFNVKPVPNILATDLRCEPHATQNRYIFSFNTNTKPEEAQIRFYYSYEDMQKSLNVVNADNYNGTNANKPAFVYNIPDGKLKQGRIEVELGGVCGKLDANNVIINDSLPAGVLYWSVYVKTRESNAFAPIYEQSTTGEDAHNRLHATVNNYPETDGFGHIYAVNYYAEFDARNGLMDYSFNPNGNSNDEQNNIKNSNRYKLVKNYLNPSGNKPKFTNQRRLAVAPDGKVYIADAGQSYPFDANADRPWMFKGGGVFVWNPNTQTPTSNEIQISLFSNKDLYGTATGVDIYNHNGQLKLYATNTYSEFDNHYNNGNLWKGKEYTEVNQADVNIYGWNGFKEYILGTPENILLQETNGTAQRSLGMGDGNGHMSLVAMDKGVWLAQHRLNDVQYTLDQFRAGVKNPALPDNTENYVLSFVPYGSNTRTWSSCTSRGINYSGSTYDQTDASELTQLTSSPLQSCPGAGLAYRKTNGKEYLYIVNHQGNIVELQITSWSGTTPTVKYIKTYPGSGPKGLNDGNRTQGAINSMCFDYAGNLITTSGEKYIGATQNILVYTMPYDRVNAREIQAPNSCRMIPERVSHMDMGNQELANIINYYLAPENNSGCYVDIFRPMFNTAFNTICLPFDVDLSQATAGAYHNATLMQFDNAVVTEVNNEKMLELQFTEKKDKIIVAGIPYLIKPENPIPGIMSLEQDIKFKTINSTDQTRTFNNGDNSITFKGIIPYQQIVVDPSKPWPLIVVDNNRLAEVSTTGYINGFRAYFQLEKELDPGTKVGISARKPTPTNVITINGKRVNIEKFLREGRVYIRVGDSLYTISGEKVE